MSVTTEKSRRINRKIDTPEVQLTGVRGGALGIVKLFDALRLAEEEDVDLVEITPTVQPPVCRPMDYDKFEYQGQKRAHDTKLKRKVIQVKEVKFRSGTDDNNYDVKPRNTTHFLEDGDRVKVTLRSHGRGMTHRGLGVCVLERIESDLEELGQVKRVPEMEGRQAVMMSAPKKER